MEVITLEEILISVYENMLICRYILLFIFIFFIITEIYSFWLKVKNE